MPQSPNQFDIRYTLFNTNGELLGKVYNYNQVDVVNNDIYYTHYNQLKKVDYNGQETILTAYSLTFLPNVIHIVGIIIVDFLIFSYLIKKEHDVHKRTQEFKNKRYE